MNKRLFMEPLVIILITVLCMTGCSKNFYGSLSDFHDVDDNSQPNAVLIRDEKVPYASEPGAALVTSDRDVYERFLANKEPAVELYDTLNWGFDVFSYEELGKPFLFSEIIGKMQAADITVKEIKYAFIDTMDKGSEQLVISMNTFAGAIEPSWEGEYADYLLVLNRVNGQLHIIYGALSVFRDETYINKYGYITENIYYSAGGGIKSQILKEDGCEFIASKGYEGGHMITPFTAYQDEQKIDINLEPLAKEGGVVYTYYYDENGLYEDEYYSIDIWDDKVGHVDSPEMEEKLYGKDSPYRKIFDDAGVKLYTIAELDKRIAEREITLGVTDKIKDGEDPDWIVIDDDSLLSLIQTSQDL